MFFDLEYTADRTYRKRKMECGRSVMLCESLALVSGVERGIYDARSRRIRQPSLSLRESNVILVSASYFYSLVRVTD